MENLKKYKLLVFIVAYNAEKTIRWVLGRIPENLLDDYLIEVLIIDDKSKDDTFKVSKSIANENKLKFPIKILKNRINQGYGGNQKIGYQYAIKNKFDIVALVHGDGQYAPEELPKLLKSLIYNNGDAIFGSRMISKYGALKGGMPFYKFIGNKILTFVQNYLLSTELSEFHSGYRIYKISALKKIPFYLNSNNFHFDTQIIIQLVLNQRKILEAPIPTYYGNEISHVNGLIYAFNVIKETLKAKLQEKQLMIDPKYDVYDNVSDYKPKFGVGSTHDIALSKINKKIKVLDIGSSKGYLAKKLKEDKLAWVFGLDLFDLDDDNNFDGFIKCDLDLGIPYKTPKNIDVILMLDIIEHLSSPEKFLKNLKEHYKLNTNIIIHCSTGNISFIIYRLLHFFGIFNYAKRGIMDITHKRLFTKSSFINLFEQNGFRIEEKYYVPVPWHLIFGNNIFSNILIKINKFFCVIWPALFAYQFYYIIKMKPHLDYLLKSTLKSK